MGSYAANLESLSQHPVPEWFRDAKLGIFVHWTAATIPAYAPLTEDPLTVAARDGVEAAMANQPYVEWYQNSIAIPGSPAAEHHATHWPGVGYEHFVERFVAASEAWDPAAWAEQFVRAGATYCVFVTKHHDGVTLWPSTTPNPFHAGWSTRRDCVSELADAVRARRMRYGVYYSGGLDWTFGGLPMHDLASSLAAIPQSPEYCAYADGHWRELIDLVGPDVLWNDIAYAKGANPEQLFADFYEANPDGVVNDRFDTFGVRGGTFHADFVTPEYSAMSDMPGKMFEVCRGIGRSFGYNAWETEADMIPADELIRMFVRIVADGGNLLLNVGPTASGEIPALQASRLDALGTWLAINGEAIYGTRPAERSRGVTGRGQEVRYTTRGTTTYAIVADPPTIATAGTSAASLELDVRPAVGATIRLLGQRGTLAWAPSEKGCRIELNAAPPASPAIALAIDGPAA